MQRGVGEGWSVLVYIGCQSCDWDGEGEKVNLLNNV